MGNKKMNRGARIGPKHQVTIPPEVMRRAGLVIGDRVTVQADGPGRVVLERDTDVLELFAGVLTGVYESESLADLRGDWD